MGIRRSACNKLEQSFAAAFGAYFVGDPDFTKSDGTPLFVAAQSVSKLLYPQVCFMCLEAVEQIALTGIFIGTLHMIIETPLIERPDDYPSLLNLHDTRVDKCVQLMSNNTLLMQLINSPPTPSPPDISPVVNFQIYGVGKIVKEQNKNENNRLCFIQSVEIPFQPIGP